MSSIGEGKNFDKQFGDERTVKKTSCFKTLIHCVILDDHNKLSIC